jgi:nitrous oxidase accessory protein NosD
MNSRAGKVLSKGGAVVAALLAAALLAGPGSARTAAAVACGSTITGNATLGSDLKCAGDGVVVAGDGVTLDLGDHVLRGSATGVGITVTGAHVTVVNGTVRGFREGVRVAAFTGGDTHLTRLAAIRNDVGVSLLSSLGSIDSSTVSDNTTDGVRVNHGDDWAVDASTIVRNGGEGLSLVLSRNLRVTHNVVTGNGRSGIASFTHVDLATIAENVVAGNGRFGITVRNSTTRVLRNVVRSNGLNGIDLLEDEGGPLFAPFYEITGNVSSKNVGAGINSCVRDGANPCAGGMVDGGGNVARFNGVAPECVNVVCGIRD